MMYLIYNLFKNGVIMNDIKINYYSNKIDQYIDRYGNNPTIRPSNGSSLYGVGLISINVCSHIFPYYVFIQNLGSCLVALAPFASVSGNVSSYKRFNQSRSDLQEAKELLNTVPKGPSRNALKNVVHVIQLQHSVNHALKNYTRNDSILVAIGICAIALTILFASPILFVIGGSIFTCGFLLNQMYGDHSEALKALYDSDENPSLAQLAKTALDGLKTSNEINQNTNNQPAILTNK